jgi:hypothetical protein
MEHSLPRAIAVDASGNAYLTGYTGDAQFPVTAGAYETTPNYKGGQAFALKLNPAGTLIWATYVGGSSAESPNSGSLDSSGNVWIGGYFFGNSPTTSALFANSEEGDFLSELSADGAALLYCEEFPGGAVGQAMALDPTGTVHVAGGAGLISTITPAQPPAARILGIRNAAAGQLSGRISPAEVISIFGFGLGPANPAIATPSNGFFLTSLAGVQVLFNGVAVPLLYVSDS